MLPFIIDRFFFHILHDDDIISQKSDNLHPMLAKAYAEVLKVINSIDNF